MEKLPGNHETDAELFNRANLFKQQMIARHEQLDGTPVTICVTHSGMVTALKSTRVLENGKLDVVNSVHLCSAHTIMVED